MVYVNGIFHLHRIHGSCKPSHSTLSLSCLGDLYSNGSGIVFRGVCPWPSSNNVVEYSVVIELQQDAISHGVLSLEVHLDSDLVVSQLNGLYHVKRFDIIKKILTCEIVRTTI